MKCYYGYVRVSTQKQGEGVSLEAQKDAIRSFADKNGYHICGWFEEEVTAAKSGRPAFNQMLRLLKQKKAQGVVMHKIDRASRNYTDWARLISLADNGTEVHYATESLDFQSRGGRLSANIQMAIAEDYIRNLKSEIRKGQRAQLERGYYPFKAPIGYLDNGKLRHKTIDPVSGPIVRRAFEIYATGQHSLRSLQAVLQEQNLSTGNGVPVSKCCIEKFLCNPFYMGVIQIKKTGELFQGGHDPLVSPALFNRCTSVRAKKYRKKNTKHQHLFRGLFNCRRCERSMIPEKQKGYTYYRCQFPGCPTNSIREEPLEEKILEILHNHQPVLEAHRAIENWLCQLSERDDPGNAERQFKLQLAKLDNEIQKLENAAIDQIISPERFQERKIGVLKQKLELEDGFRKSSDYHRHPAVIKKFLERLKNLAAHYENTNPADKREIAEIATSNRKVEAKNVYIEPAMWLEATKQSLGVFCCGDAPATSRTEMKQKESIKQLAAIANSPEVERLFSLFIDDYEKSGKENVPKTIWKRDDDGRLIGNNSGV